MNGLTRRQLFGCVGTLGSRVVASGARHTALGLALALPMATWMIIAAAPDASASCSPSHHCWATYDNANANTNHGIFGSLNAHCLHMPSGNGSFVTNQIWDTSSNGAFWEEVGLYSGVGFNIPDGDRNWFWGDSRPGSNFFEHNSPTQATLDTNYRTKVEFAGNNTWNIFGDGNYSHWGTSVNQSATLVTGEAGSEYSAGSGSGMRDVGHIGDLQRKSSSDTWFSWGNNVVPGNTDFIISTWDGSSSTVSWTGPC
jgi:hypothetical protein